MKNTMNDIANKYYYIDIVDLWDEIAERKNMRKATEEEVAEQKALRAEYIAEFRASFTGILENTVIQYPDGSRQSLPDMRDTKKNEKK